MKWNLITGYGIIKVPAKMETITVENIDDYTVEIIDNKMILKPKIIFLNETELFEKDLAFSKIISCKINDISFDIKTYNKLYENLHKTIKDTTTTMMFFNTESEPLNNHIFIKPIIDIVKRQNYKLELTIKLAKYNFVLSKKAEIIHFMI